VRGVVGGLLGGERGVDGHAGVVDDDHALHAAVRADAPDGLFALG
jgi:hypothetical protein